MSGLQDLRLRPYQEAEWFIICDEVGETPFLMVKHYLLHTVVDYIGTNGGFTKTIQST
jgi:hypothetical protein